MTIDFSRLAADLLAKAPEILPAWLPAGKKRGREWVCGDLAGKGGGSLSINMTTGVWADFASGDRGGDLISLYAAINRIGQADAARQLTGDEPALRLITPPAAAPTAAKKEEKFTTAPPHGVDPPDFENKTLGSPNGLWRYLSETGNLLGYVARYDPPGERKVYIPFSWAGRWQKKQFSDPRPLYGLELLAARPEAPVMLVEGEKSADAARKLAGDIYLVLSWPGGGHAWAKADFSPLYGRKILIWPDADAPGTVCATSVAEFLLPHCQEIKFVDVSDRSDGWDAADALSDGWDWQRLKEWARARVKVVEPKIKIKPLNTVNNNTGQALASDVVDINAVRKKKELPAPAKWEGYWEARPWAAHIIKTDEGKAKNLLANAITALRHDEAWRGIIGWDEFALQTVALKNGPAGIECGQWSGRNDLIATEWLQRIGLFVSLQITEQAVEAVAHENPFHPVRDYLHSLQWDGVPRINSWLTDFCGADKNEYTAAVGSKWLISAVARVMQPGCKVDTALIFEGPQGLNKSTAFEVLGGRWFTDDMPEMHGKAAAECVAGAWIIEIAELAAMGRSDVESAKAFITRRVDRFRAAYARRVSSSPRQSVFCGTVNPEGGGYLKDSENRRFWPVRIGDVDVAGLSVARDQIWAEAVVKHSDGVQWWLSGDIVTVAKQEQECRRQKDEWEAQIEKYITHLSVWNVVAQERVWTERTSPLSEISVGDALENALGVPASRWTQSDQNRVSRCLKSLGWERFQKREGSSRVWLYRSKSPLLTGGGD